ncbi:hypothetical protein [Flavobacterium psychrophilum]|uniref:hypothetical protein n=1 Tax=Flavobacterium psychrophilum TaxID=96345 RepID=UPI001C8F48DE|nr:hypothetical protein [Flavobacterium psychrophilum]EKT3958230.1 hypothetical protein [Flavobacterium psychrophilum]EKT4510539.1 hypothetical protein [Flavobacterium psychrophilum]QZK98523.1 hypothetical protein K5L05_02230 [Flavobacterium psychrophilum]
MKEEQIKKAADFLGVKVLSPLEEKTVVGGIAVIVAEHHDHTDEGRHHSHHDS